MKKLSELCRLPAEIGFILMLVVISAGLCAPAGAEEAAAPIYPAALEEGDTIAIVAPAGPMSVEEVQRGARHLESLGFRVRLPENIDRQHRFFAGTDEVRGAELMAAFEDGEVDALFAARGGYGAMRILDSLDYEVIKANPKILIGYSDITALHTAIHQRTGLVTFHGPNIQGGTGATNGLTPFSRHYLWRALRQDEQGSAGYALLTALPGNGGQEPAIPPLDSLSSGVARGRLVGGNLSVVHALMGTPYELETSGKVLFLEDIGEAPYRVDRMLQTLKLAGKLGNLKGVLLGSFTRRAEEDTSGETTSIDQVVKEYFGELGIPVVTRFPAGHQSNNATLPIGGLVEINGDEPGVRLLENPVNPAK
jgi:muramoyltetrapeptide carboxypeptidase